MSLSERINGATSGAADRLDVRAVIVVVLCCASWGVNQVAIKIANAGIAPILQAGLRSLIACVLVFAWAALRGVRLFERDGTLRAGVGAGILFGAEFVALYAGLGHTTASRAGVLFYASPFVVAIGAHFLIPGDRLSIAKVVGLSAALAGVAVAMGDGLTAPSRPTLVGDLMSLLAAVFWGATTVFVRATALRSAPPEKTLLYQLAVSGLMLPAASLLMGEPGVTDLSAPVLAAFAYTVIVVAFASYIGWFWLVRNYPPTRVAAFTSLGPVFGVLAGNLMLGEPFTPSLAAALALIAFSILLVNRAARP
jgi:drug/metabolite transporter (DMT)-like permease